MARKIMLGHKVRMLRRGRGSTQVQTAVELGISPSYLNLIEHNQRPLTLPLLLKVARLFEADLQTFADDDEARLAADLAELFGDPLFRDERPSEAELDELAGAMPAVGQAVLALYSAFRNAQENAQALSERYSDDAFLSASTHELLTLLTSIRSFSEILHDNIDLASTERQRFLEILVEESRRLADLANRLRDFTRGGGLRGLLGTNSPSEEVADFIEDHANHFADIEDAAEDFRRAAGVEGAELRERLVRHLARRHRVTVETVPWDVGAAGLARPELESGRLRLSEHLAASSVDFELARHVGLLSYADIFEPYLAHGRLTTPEARSLCGAALAKYFAAAVMMPYAPFLAEARALRYDLELLRHRFGASFEQVCHRLTSLQRPGAAGVPFHFVRLDIAGNISKRFPGSGMRIPRFGGACPRWNVHEAFMAPGAISTQLARMPDGLVYFCVARTVTKRGGGHREPKSHLAIALGCEVSHARQLVYADAVDLETPDAAVPVGVTCRLCERTDCAQRAAPPLIRPAVEADGPRPAAA